MTVYVARVVDQQDPRLGKICAVYRQPQDAASEALPDDHPDVLEWNAYVNATPSATDMENYCIAFLGGQAQLAPGNSRIDVRKVLQAKCISDLAWRLGVAPGALTAQQIGNERVRIAAIYKAL